MKRFSLGFTLVELLIVIAIIAVSHINPNIRTLQLVIPHRHSGGFFNCNTSHF